MSVTPNLHGKIKETLTEAMYVMYVYAWTEQVCTRLYVYANKWTGVLKRKRAIERQQKGKSLQFQEAKWEWNGFFTLLTLLTNHHGKQDRKWSSAREGCTSCLAVGCARNSCRASGIHFCPASHTIYGPAGRKFTLYYSRISSRTTKKIVCGISLDFLGFELLKRDSLFWDV